MFFHCNLIIAMNIINYNISGIVQTIQYCGTAHIARHLLLPLFATSAAGIPFQPCPSGQVGLFTHLLTDVQLQQILVY